MFCRLESFVRGILQKLSIGLKETLIQRADCSRILKKEKKKSKCSKRPKISHDGSSSKTTLC